MPNEPALVLILCPLFFPIPTPSSFPSSLLMFNAEKQLIIDATNQQLTGGEAVSSNLYTGLAYGASPISIASLSLFVLRMPDRLFLSSSRNVPSHVPDVNKDTSVRSRAFHFRLTRRPRERSTFLFSLPHAAPRVPYSVVWNTCSCLRSR